MIEHQLDQRSRDRGDAPPIVCWFNAWMHDGAADLATAFVAAVSRTADVHREPLTRLLYPLPAAVLTPAGRRRRRVRSSVLAMLTMVVTLYWIGSHLEHLEARKRAQAELLAKATFQKTETIIRDAGNTETARSEATTRTQLDPLPPA